MKVHTEKVVCYVVRAGHLLTFTHDDLPLTEVGVQVPAGTIRPGETPEQAALREATEETGLDDLSIVRRLGESRYDISPYRYEIMHRHFFQLTTSQFPRPPWKAGEPDPEGGGPELTWTCRWTPLAQAHVLSGGLGVMIGRLVGGER